MKHLQRGVHLVFFFTWIVFCPRLLAAEETLEFATPSGPFLEVEHVGPQDSVFPTLIVTADTTQESVHKGYSFARVILTTPVFADAFAKLGETLARKNVMKGPCNTAVAHPQYSYAVSGRITGRDAMEFCFVLNPRDSTRLLQGLLIDSLKNVDAPAELTQVIDEILSRMPHD